jgi:NTP pyrophosphatase (non-canonical NTP hydrolase)
MEIGEFQKLIEREYFERDRARGLSGTFMWFVEEVGELSTALRHGTLEEQKAEFADVFAWLVTLASIQGIKMEDVVAKYAEGCPYCKKIPCECSQKK